MSAKQDRQGARTPTDLERKYKFGETFAEILGIAADARDAAEKAQNDFDGLTMEQIFNILTDNGTSQGVFIVDENGAVYINASYLRSGVISSEDGTIIIDLSKGAAEPVFNTGISTNGIIVRGDEVDAPKLLTVGVGTATDGITKSAFLELYDINGNRLAQFSEASSGDGGGLTLSNDTGTLMAISQATGTSAGFRLLLNGIQKAYLGLNIAGESALQCDNAICNKIKGKTISWKDNGDGTFTLVGQ